MDSRGLLAFPRGTRFGWVCSLSSWWHRFVAAHIVADDPHPVPSRLDRWDGQR